MALETGTYISDLNASNPVGATDKVSTLDDHVRLVKSSLLATFPSITGAVTASHTELNHLDGVTGTTGTGQLVLDDTPTIDKLTVTTSITLPATSIADAALSSNVPLKNAANTFTATQTVSGTRPAVVWIETDAGEDETRWEWAANVSGFRLSTMTDTGTFGEAAITLLRTGTNVDSIALAADAITLNGVNVDNYARTDQNEDFSGSLTAVNYAAQQNGGGGFSWWDDPNTFIWSPGADQIAFVTGSVTALALASGAVLAPTIANSTSETLVPGQIHHVDDNCTVPTLAAGQWVAIVNHSASPITLTRRSGTALYWTATGADSATVTIPARGRVVVSCAAAGSDYVGGDITGNTT